MDVGGGGCEVVVAGGVVEAAGVVKEGVGMYGIVGAWAVSSGIPMMYLGCAKDQRR